MFIIATDDYNIVSIHDDDGGWISYIFVIRTYIAMGKYIGFFKLLTFTIFHLLVTPPNTRPHWIKCSTMQTDPIAQIPHMSRPHCNRKSNNSLHSNKQTKYTKKPMKQTNKWQTIQKKLLMHGKFWTRKRSLLPTWLSNPKSKTVVPMSREF